MRKIDAVQAKALWEQADEFVKKEHDELMADPATTRTVTFTMRESEILGQVVAQAVLDTEEDIQVERANGDEDGLLNTYRVRAVFKSVADKFIKARAAANPNGHTGGSDRSA